MTLRELADAMKLECVTPELTLSGHEVAGGYVSDLLSDVLAHAPYDGVLVTIQVHLNVIAVALHAGLSGVIFASGRIPEDSVRAKAVEEKIPLFVAQENAFEVVGRLYALGVRGSDG